MDTLDLDTIRAQLALVPDLQDDPKVETFGEGLTRTRHVVRRTDGAVPFGSFMADIVINDFFDVGATYLKHPADRVAVGEALIQLLVHGPAIMRRLIARIDELEGSTSDGR